MPGLIERIRGKSAQQNINVGTIHFPQPTFAVATSTADANIQLVTYTATALFQTDSAGTRVSAAYPYYLTTDTAGVTALGATIVTGSSRGSTTIGGAVLNETTGNDFRKGVLVTNTTGSVQVALTSTGTSTAYMVVVQPNGRLSVSGAIVWT